MVKSSYYIVLLIFTLSVFFSCRENIPSQDAQERKVAKVNETAEKVLALNGNQKLLRKGYVDVTTSPYYADSTGETDATAAIQQALKDARDARMVCYLPAGRYLVSNTITGIQGTVLWDNWHFEGFVDPWLSFASFEYPNVLMGSSGENRATIILADHADGFGDPTNPKPVVHFWSRMEYGKIDKSKPQPNINFNQKIIDVDFELGKGNSGAVAINHQGAEGSTIESVNIDAEGAFAGVQNAPGSGGGIFGVSITGGKYGFYLHNSTRHRGSQPSPVIAGVKLTGQTDISIYYDARGPLTLVGAVIDGAGIWSDCPSSVNWNGAMNLVDVVIRLKNKKEAIRSNHSVVLDNVFIKNADTLVNIKNGQLLTGNEGEWGHIIKGTFAGIAKTGTWAGDSLRRDAIWINNLRTDNSFLEMDSRAPEFPGEFIRKHLWPSEFPTGVSQTAVNVMDSPYFAKGDGISDDSEAIQKAIDENEVVFVPKGRFAISKTLKLNSRTKLIGLGNVQTVITTTADPGVFTDPDNPRPLIETVDDPEAATSLAFMELLVPVRNPCVYAICWRAGENSIVRDVYSIREPSHPGAAVMGHQMVKIEKSGGGKWFDNVFLHWWDQGPNYHHLLIDATTEPLKFYMLEPQHGRGNYMVKIKNSKNIDVFSVKSEGDYGVISLNNCSNFRIFGYAGNGMPNPGFSLFDVKNSDDFFFANINPQFKNIGHYGALGTSHDPNTWYILRNSGINKKIEIKGTEQFAIFLSERSK